MTQKKQPTLPERLTVRLRKLGFTERKAKAVAKGLAPLVQALIKAATVAKPTSAPDLPKGAVAPVAGGKGLPLMQVMDGLTSTATYLVAAVKADVGLIAIRKFDDDYFNVKFYPTLDYWGFTEESLIEMGAHSLCERDWYHRMVFTRRALDRLLDHLEVEKKPKARMKGLMDRLQAVTIRPLLEAFATLYKQSA